MSDTNTELDNIIENVIYVWKYDTDKKAVKQAIEAYVAQKIVEELNKMILMAVDPDAHIMTLEEYLRGRIKELEADPPLLKERKL